MPRKSLTSRLMTTLTAGLQSLSTITGIVGTLAAFSMTSAVAATKSGPTKADLAIPRYNHIFVIIEENKTYQQVIGQSFAPYINYYANTYGLATNYYGVAHPSEENYIAMLGGDTFGIHDDDAYFCKPGSADAVNCPNANNPNYAGGYKNHTVNAPSLMDQLEGKGLTWKGYFQDLPYSGYKGANYPNTTDALYAVKHNGFLTFASVQNDPSKLGRIVPIEQLDVDLKSGNVPNFSHIVANQCQEMHGLGAGVADGCDYGNSGTNDVDANLQNLIQTGDAKLGALVSKIIASSVWKKGNNAIVLAFDEDNAIRPYTQGCCGYDPNSASNFGGGLIPMAVITNHGPRGVVDKTPYNHYSLLRTIEDAFGIYDYLGLAGATDKGVQPMTPLFSTK